MQNVLNRKLGVSELVSAIRVQKDVSTVDIDTLLAALSDFTPNDVVELVTLLAQDAVSPPATATTTHSSVASTSTTTTTTTTTAVASTLVSSSSSTKRVLDALLEHVAWKVLSSVDDDVRTVDASLLDSLVCSQSIDIESVNATLNNTHSSTSSLRAASLPDAAAGAGDENRSSVLAYLRNSDADERSQLLGLLVQAAMRCISSNSAVVRTQGLNVLGSLALRFSTTNSNLRAAHDKVLVVLAFCCRSSGSLTTFPTRYIVN
jgi:hypothetical protein